MASGRAVIRAFSPREGACCSRAILPGNFRAFDAATGKSLWHFPLGVLQSNAPSTFTIDGRQYAAGCRRRHAVCVLSAVTPSWWRWPRCALRCRCARKVERKPPPADPVVVQRGMTTYTSTCASCHGTDARGGRGPDLARSLVIIGDPTGKTMAAFVRAVTRARCRPSISPMRSSVILRCSCWRPRKTRRAVVRRIPRLCWWGILRLARRFFNGQGKCASCHSVTGDLKGVGAKYAPQQLQGRIAFPRGRGGYPGFGQAAADPPLILPPPCCQTGEGLGDGDHALRFPRHAPRRGGSSLYSDQDGGCRRRGHRSASGACRSH